jgi:uncharacterized membrane protein
MAPQQTGSPVDKLVEELQKYLTQQVEALASKAGDKLSGLADRLTDSAENGTPLGIGGRILKGDSPLKAVGGGALGKVKEKIPGLGGKEGGDEESGGSQDGPGDVKATSIIEYVDVGVPLRTAYDHWSGYEEFSSFTKGVRDVSKEDEVSSDWRLQILWSARSWKATVAEQIPDDRIVWKSEGGKGTTHGVVSFHELAPTLTRVVLTVEYYPSGFFEKTANIWRAQGRRMRLDLKHFQRYVTFATEEPEGWRGEIRDGEVVRSHEDALAEEEEEPDGDAQEPDADEEFDDEEAEDAEPEEDEPEEDEEEDDGDEEDEAPPERPAKGRTRRR